ncbi:MAG: alkaline phosphatase D family protein [Melioribacteraceae bacterium]|nr:alkaline phosphatase D family protein [Melioribacteraceae bacterium]MCF8265791.1 alkaline phosphatase D family protein [Melioribacteraceae bacterium]
MYINTKKLLIALMLTITLTSCEIWERSPNIFQATGIKIGEVTTSTAIIWTRLTADSIRVDNKSPMPVVEYFNHETKEWADAERGKALQWEPRVIYPNQSDIHTIEGAAPGKLGEVRVLYKPETEMEWLKTEWREVDVDKDFTRQFPLANLIADTKYLIKVESREIGTEYLGQVIDGNFTTAPDLEDQKQLLFTVTTGTAYRDLDTSAGFKMYYEMLKLNPDFFIHTGDILYYDKLAKTKELAEWHWARMYSLPSNVEFHKQVPSYFIKDDHDTWVNDCWPTRDIKYMGEFTFEQGLEIFTYEVPIPKPTYRTVRWGKDLQMWFVEGRDFRSPNNMEDGPEKTIWGKEQLEWLFSTFEESDATFRILVSPTPIVGPDRIKKNDNHANKGFRYEGNLIREFLSKQTNSFVICGDRHWQYISEDLKTKVREYSCGPASDSHSGGWNQNDVLPEHKYLNVRGGFLSVEIKRESGEPIALMKYYSPEGDLLHEDKYPTI